MKKDWKMLPPIHQGVMSSWNILKKFLKEQEVVRYSNGWNPLSSKAQIKKRKEYHAKRREASKQEAPVASTSKAHQPTSPRGEEEQEKELEEAIFPRLQYSKNPKRCHGQYLQDGQNLDGIQRQRETKNETTPFHKKITLSPDVVNTLTEIKNRILNLQDIKSSLLSLQKNK
ncbi:hypothetical protein O181_118749 [Austropuccinia psidii MF-1]|uniref:Uncharacterized protein n=1 Tax=Austropuccinia psidii MF-1 TaxID=1389203 RepID=A0A9Q3PYS2_9BASI|nr:hypothetical protein [Austropuccinia psidii MF-1]